MPVNFKSASSLKGWYLSFHSGRDPTCSVNFKIRPSYLYRSKIMFITVLIIPIGKYGRGVKGESGKPEVSKYEDTNSHPVVTIRP